MANNVEIGERIRELRETQNDTREKLAEKANLSSKFLYEIETGKKGFSADTLCRISKVLSVSCDYIMYGEEKGDQTIQKVACVLEMLEPGQMNKLQDVIKILYKVCDIF